MQEDLAKQRDLLDEGTARFDEADLKSAAADLALIDMMDLLKAARGQGPNALYDLNINARQAYNDLAAALKDAESEEAFLASGAMEKFKKTI